MVGYGTLRSAGRVIVELLQLLALIAAISGAAFAGKLTSATSSASSSSSECHPEDRAALLSLAAAIYDLPEVSSNISSHCGSNISESSHHARSIYDEGRNISFPSVLIGYVDGRVASLEVYNIGFFGEFPPQICNLTALRTLRLLFNNLTGPLPPCIGTHLSLLTDLELSDNGLSGSIPPQIAHLRNLSSLRFSGNNFDRAAPFPPFSLGNLSNLQVLDLSDNNFDPAPFPLFLGNLSKLEILDLSYNSFYSAIPPEWANLHHLRGLDLSGNPFSAVSANLTLPISLPSIERLTLRSMGWNSMHFTCEQLKLIKSTIRELDISDNHLSSSTLDCFCQFHFPSLYMLSLSHNPLHSRLNPSAVLLTPQLKYLGLSSCGLSGQLTNNFFSIAINSQSPFIDLSHNKLHGKLPSVVVNLQRRGVIIDVSYNLFTGLEKLAPVLQLHNNSNHNLHLSHNKLQGDLGDFLESLWGSGLTEEILCPWSAILDVSFNEFTGRVPLYLANCSRLEILKMGNNYLSGEIPAKLGLLTMLTTLSMHNNKLEGTIPSSLSNCSSLELLDLSSNMLHGDISQALFSSHVPQNLPSLRVLLLNNNYLIGTIPQSLGISSPLLQLIGLSNNRFHGAIPNHLHLPSFKVAQTRPATDALYEADIDINVKGRSTRYTYILNILTSIDLSGNALSGTIPPKLGELTSLVHLILSRNNLSGSIPAELSKLRVLESLDLSFNKLTGSIPSELGTLTSLANFNVSFNKGLSGTIPTGPQLDDNTSYVGDDKLCGIPKPRPCAASSDFHKDVAEADDEHHHWHGFVGWMQGWASMEGIILGFVVGFVWTMVVLHVIKPRFRRCLI